MANLCGDALHSAPHDRVVVEHAVEVVAVERVQVAVGDRADGRHSLRVREQRDLTCSNVQYECIALTYS